MSKRLKKENAFVDTGFLRDHVSKLREEKKIASKLYDNVVLLRNVSDPTIAYQYNSVLRDISQMIEYFDRMAVTLDNVDDKAMELNHILKMMIEDDTENVHHTTSNTFML